jgi:IS30 family transposase
MTLECRNQLVNAWRDLYHAADLKEKTEMLNQFVDLTGFSRKYAISKLASKKRAVAKKRNRKRTYDSKVAEALAILWQASNYICAKRLIPFVPVLLDSLERHRHISIDADTRSKLLKMSAATADRILKKERIINGKGTQVSARQAHLRRKIPIRTFSDWTQNRPGFFEIDTVHHDGGDLKGPYALTLTMTDVATGWTALVALKRKSEQDVLAAIIEVRKRLPFKLCGIDVDNGCEFINYLLFGWCRAENIEFTRGREGRKNDGCYVEQKNGAVVRQLVGYERYGLGEAFESLQAIYELSWYFVNYFQPSMKLISKERRGARIYRQYDRAKTPVERLMGCETTSEPTKQKLLKNRWELDPVMLLKKRQTLLSRLDELTEANLLSQATASRESDASPELEATSVVVPKPPTVAETRTAVKVGSERNTVRKALEVMFNSVEPGEVLERTSLFACGRESVVSDALSCLAREGFIERVSIGKYIRLKDNFDKIKSTIVRRGTIAALRNHFLDNAGMPIATRELTQLGHNRDSVKLALQQLKKAGFIENNRLGYWQLSESFGLKNSGT